MSVNDVNLFLDLINCHGCATLEHRQMYQERQNHLKQYTNKDCGKFAKVVGVCGLWMIVTGTNDLGLKMDISLSPTGLSATCCVSPQQFGEYLHWTFLGHWWDLTKKWLSRAQTKCVGQANEIKNRKHLIKTRGKFLRRHEEIKSNQLWRLAGQVVTHQICFILLFHLSEGDDPDFSACTDMSITN